MKLPTKFPLDFFWQVRREFTSFFYSPIAYVVIGISAMLNGGTFYLIMKFLAGGGPTAEAPMEVLYSTALFWFVVLILTPLLTMRSLAEERHTGTLETLVTAPVSDVRIVLAKYVSALSFYILMWSPTLLYPIVLQRYVPVDMGPIVSAWIGTVGLGVMLVAVGILCSSFTRNQIVAAIVTFAFTMCLFLAGFFSYVDGMPFQETFQYLDMSSHMRTFARGVVDTRPLIYYVSVAAFALFASVQVLGARRWRS